MGAVLLVRDRHLAATEIHHVPKEVFLLRNAPLREQYADVRRQARKSVLLDHVPLNTVHVIGYAFRGVRAHRRLHQVEVATFRKLGRGCRRKGRACSDRRQEQRKTGNVACVHVASRGYGP